MKISPLLLIVLLCPTPLIAQDSVRRGPANPVEAKISSPSGAGTWRASIRDGSSTEWEMLDLITNHLTGQVEPRTHRYIEVADGLNYLDASLTWQRSVDQIELTPATGGAAALRGPLKAYFPPVLNGKQDGVTLVTASNTMLKIKPIGLYYFDAESGKSVLLASLQTTEGELLPPNQVVYRSALQGESVLCDLRYTYTKGAFESDLLILRNPAPPEAYGLNSSTTRLELWHETKGPSPAAVPKVLSAVADPTIRHQMAEPDFVDETLDFGDVWFPQGRAFSWETPTAPVGQLSPDQPAKIRIRRPTASAGEVIVGKRWGQIGDRSGLCESVRWVDIKAQLDSLPNQGSIPSRPLRRPRNFRELPDPSEPELSLSATNFMKLSQNPYTAKGFLLDYTVLSSGTTYSFVSGETYLISSFASFKSTVDFFPGCILKYNDEASLYLTGPIVSHGTANAPSIFTSFNDFAFGEKNLPGATGYPNYAATEALWLGNTSYPLTLSGLKIRWAHAAILAEAIPGAAVAHSLVESSLEWCETGVYANNCSIEFRNSRVCSLGTLMSGENDWSYTGTPTDVCTGDADQNGFLDSWEYKFFGHTGVDLLGDPDADGVRNFEEYNLGLNPQVADASPAQLQAILSPAPLAVLTPDPTFQGQYSGLVRAMPGSGAGPPITPLTSGCVTAPTNLVGWWRGEGDATDAVGGNDGKYCGNSPGYTTGEVGQGFYVNPNGWGPWNYIRVPSSPVLKLTNEFTVEMWYKDTGTEAYTVGLLGKITPTVGFSITLLNTNSITMIFSDSVHKNQYIGVTPAPTPGVFHHLAASWRQVGTNIEEKLYIDGAFAAMGTFAGNLATVVNDAPLTIGTDRPTGDFFTGIIDDVAIYSRALGTNEIAAIYNAGSYGKCVPTNAPTMLVQPISQTVPADTDVLLSAQASGSPKLAYQWRLNGTAISGATNYYYITNNVQVGQNGNYSVVVTNAYGAITSSTVSLSITSAPSCITAPSNLVAWWRAESNAADEVGDNTGILLNGTTYVTGKSGQAFSFLGYPYGTCVNIPSSPALNLTNELTYEIWYKGGANSGTCGILNKYPIPERCCCSTVAGNYGVIETGDDYYMDIYLSDTNYGMQGLVYWPPPMPGMFHHLAVTYHQSTSTALLISIYLDGQLVLTNSVLGNLANALNDSPVTLGAWRPDGSAAFMGVIDEAAIYSRALTASEVLSIYNAGSGAKCLMTTAPQITTQPTNQTVSLGDEVALSLFASGTPPLSYQWRFNGTAITGATNKLYIINDAQAAAGGNYTVQITNSYGSVTSQVATLTVGSAASCDSPPSGLISWWRAEGDVTDCVGNNNGSLVNGAGLTTGKINQGFQLFGTNYVQVPSTSSLRLTNAFTLELWYKDTGSLSTYGLFSKLQNTSPYAGNFAIWVAPNDVVIAGFRDTTINFWQYVEFAPVPVVGMFHHLVAVYQQTDSLHITINLYVDGQCAAAGTYSGNLANTLSDAALTIGSLGTTGNYFTGIIDEVAIYSRAVSSAEIQALYNASASGKCLTGDYDNDGLPDGWERQYFGNLSQLPNGDPDGDNLSNLQEYLLGTNPTNNDLGLKVLITTPKTGPLFP